MSLSWHVPIVAGPWPVAGSLAVVRGGPLARGACLARSPRGTGVFRPAGLRGCADSRLHTFRMSNDTYRDDDDTDQPGAYWRRRAITLAAGLGLLGLLAWAFSGSGGRPARPAPKSSQASGTLPAAASSGAPSSSPGATGSGPAQAGRGGAAVTPAASSGSGVEPGGGCSPGAVVLSLFSSRSDYYGGQYPEFRVYAVSTASRACSFDVGPARLRVVVMSSGRVIWDSADCARGEPNRDAELRRGIPVQESVTWNRVISLPGCVTLASARPGTYQVQARTTAVTSPVHTLRLRRLPLEIGPQDGGQRLAHVLYLLDPHEVGKAVGALQRAS